MPISRSPDVARGSRSLRERTRNNRKRPGASPTARTQQDRRFSLPFVGYALKTAGNGTFPQAAASAVPAP